MADGNAKELKDAIHDLQTRQDLIKMRAAEAKKHGNPWNMDYCMSSPNQFSQFQALFDTMSRSFVEQARQLALTPPGIASYPERLAAGAIQIPTRKRWPLPQWLHAMCTQRGHFQNCAVVHRDYGEADNVVEHWWLFMFAMQSPQDVCLASITPRS